MIVLDLNSCEVDYMSRSIETTVTAATDSLSLRTALDTGPTTDEDDMQRHSWASTVAFRAGYVRFPLHFVHVFCEPEHEDDVVKTAKPAMPEATTPAAWIADLVTGLRRPDDISSKACYTMQHATDTSCLVAAVPHQKCRDADLTSR